MIQASQKANEKRRWSVYANAQASLRICFMHPQDRLSRSEAQIYFFFLNVSL